MIEFHTASDILGDTRALLAHDLNAMDRYLQTQLQSDIPLINTLSEHITRAGGKRIRPMLVLLVARALDYHDTHAVILAVIIECIHTATLLHDDIVDNAHLRRGHATANALWGNNAAVLVGDFLYSRSFQMMVEIGRLDVMAVLSNTTNTLAEGEVLQLTRCGDTLLNEADYYTIIERKTACLFAAATMLAAQLTDASPAVVETMHQFGLHFGYAYQLIDDALDYSGDHRTGKQTGKDLAEGKMTLPLIHALAHTDNKAALLKAIDRRKTSVILAAIKDTQAARYTLEKARSHATQCQSLLATLPPSPYRNTLEQLTHFIVTRQA